MKSKIRKSVRIFRIGGFETGTLQGAGWMALFTAHFWRRLVFNGLWFGLVPVWAAAFLVMFLLYVFAADFAVWTAFSKAVVFCVWCTLCYGIGVWSVVCHRFGVNEPDEDDQAEAGTHVGTWGGYLILAVLAVLFFGWLFWPAIGYWLWGKGDSVQALIGPVFRGLLVVAFLCPVVWSGYREK